MGSTLRVNGLPHQLNLLIKAASADAEDHQIPTPLIASGVRVREAGAFAELAALEFPGGDAPRDILNRGRLEKMARASDLLVLLNSALLPHLRRNPTDSVVLKILEGCIKVIRVEGRGAGGSFHRETIALADRIEAYLLHARGHIQFSPYGALLEEIGDIGHRVENLLNTTYTLKQTEAGAAEAEAAAEAGAVAAAEAGFRLHVDGVCHLLKCASANANHPLLPTLVVASSVRVREAGAFAQLAALEELHVTNRAPLQRMARASDLLVLLESAVLPHLEEFPVDDVVLNIVEGCSEAIRMEAREAGGSFYRHTCTFADGMEAYLVSARCNVSNSSLREMIRNIMHNVKLLHDSICTLKQISAGAAAEAEGEEA